MRTSKMELCDMHRARRRVRIIATILTPVFLIAVSVLTVYLIFRPMKPQASVARATVYRMSANNGGNSSELEGSPYALAVSAQFMLLQHNPSDHAVVFYDGLLAYMMYHREVMVLPVQLPGVVQESCTDVALSPLFGLSGGVPVPVSADTAGALADDCAARRVQVQLVIMGRVKYKSGPIRTGWHDLDVRCDVTVGLRVDTTLGDDEASDVPLLKYPQCFIDA